MEMKMFTAHDAWPKGVGSSLHVRTKCCIRTISKWETDLESEVTEFVYSKRSPGIEWNFQRPHSLQAEPRKNASVPGALYFLWDISI